MTYFEDVVQVYIFVSGRDDGRMVRFLVSQIFAEKHILGGVGWGALTGVLVVSFSNLIG